MKYQEVRGEILEAPWSAGANPPRTPAPLGAVDTHHHIFDPRFQKVGELVVPPTTVADYKLFKRRLGLTRSIVVAPSNYGFDNACLLDALEQLGLQQARGVAMLHPDISDAELDDLHARGVRGWRVYFGKNRIPTADEVRLMGRRAQERGWSLQFVGSRDKEVLIDWEDVFKELPCPIVIDHFGWAPQPQGIDSDTAKMMFRLLDGGAAYVKLSGLYLSSQVGFPSYSDLDPLAEKLVKTAPDRLIWGSDWPHPMAKERPDGAMLFDRLSEWAPAPEIRHKILVDNPGRLYWPEEI
jgi:D-galactarolactone isomerase